jgi:hypothetical protein
MKKPRQKKYYMDERQRLDLHRFGFYAFIFTLLALLAGCLMQTLFLKAPFSQMAVELIVLIIGGVSLYIAWLTKAGLSYYPVEPFNKSYFIKYGLMALGFSLAFTGVEYATSEKLRAHPERLLLLLAILICLNMGSSIGLRALAMKRRKKLEKKYGGEEE